MLPCHTVCCQTEEQAPSYPKLSGCSGRPPGRRCSRAPALCSTRDLGWLPQRRRCPFVRDVAQVRGSTRAPKSFGAKLAGHLASPVGSLLIMFNHLSVRHRTMCIQHCRYTHTEVMVQNCTKYVHNALRGKAAHTVATTPARRRTVSRASLRETAKPFIQQSTMPSLCPLEDACRPPATSEC